MSHTKKIIFTTAAVFLLCLSFSQTVKAFEIFDQLGAAAGETGAGFKVPEDPRLIVAGWIKIFLSILGILFLGLMLYAGFTIMTARGEDDKIEEGKKTIRHAVMGLIIVLSTFSITLLAEKIATGDAKHKGDYIENKDETDFRDPSTQRGDNPQLNDGCAFGKRQPNGDCLLSDD